MAMVQSGISLSRIIILAGAGYTGTVLVKKGKLSDILGELQSLVKGLEKSGEQDADSDLSDAVASQVRRLAMEVRQLASSRQITVLNGDSGGNATSLIIPAATLGALGYGYMWWKGLSFSDLMYVTKKNMNAAVTNLTKHLERVSDTLDLAKKHLTQRMQNLTDKVDKQTAISKDIQKSVEEASEDLSKVECNLRDLQSMIYCLDGKIDSLRYKQDITNIGMYYLCSFVDGKSANLPEDLQEQLQLGDKARRLLNFPRTMGLKEISDTIDGTLDQPKVDVSVQDDITSLDGQPRRLLRASSILN